MGKMKTLFFLLVFAILIPFPVRAASEDRNMTMCRKVIEKMKGKEADGGYIDTGISVNGREEAETFRNYFCDYYYNGNASIQFALSGNTMLVRPESPGQPYEEHIAATAKLKEIAALIPDGTQEEMLDRIYRYIISHVKYADNDTVEAVRSMNETGRRDFSGIYATVYTAVMDGKSVCNGFAMMFERLCAMKGIQCEVQKTPYHAYDAVKLKGELLFYDTATDSVYGAYHISGRKREDFLKLPLVQENRIYFMLADD